MDSAVSSTQKGTPSPQQDKRHIAQVFRERLQLLMNRRGESASRFAGRNGLDRSAMSQFLDENQTRLPRPEALAAIATINGVSIDWLLGISQHENSMGEMASLSGVEMARDNIEHSPLAEWRREAIGHKIRYVPTTIPDLLRTRAVTAYEFGARQQAMVETKAAQSRSQLDYSRRPESDMEVVMPKARLEQFARGEGYWKDLPRGTRIAQIEYMAETLDELYPTFRLYLYDERQDYLAPYTVFGNRRAALYLGELYLVVNSSHLIRELTLRFDQLIRKAEVTADRAAPFVARLIRCAA